MNSKACIQPVTWILSSTCSALVLFLLVTPVHAIKNPVGFNVHLHQRFHEYEYDDATALLQNNQLKWAREQFDWDTIESTDGSYDFSGYDTVVQAYSDAHVNVLGLLTYSSEWASSSSDPEQYYFAPPDTDAWEDYIWNVVDHYKDDIHHWEIWNEPNIENFWTGDRETYAELLQSAYTQIKSADPDATVIIGGTSGADTDFLHDLHEYYGDAQPFDMVAIHPYRNIGSNFTYAPEQTADQLDSLLTDLRRTRRTVDYCWGDDVKIWITEFGWSTSETGADGISTSLQRAYLMRYITQALTVPNVKKVFIYELRDSGTETTNTEHHFGVVDRDMQDKGALSGVSSVAQHLQNSTYRSIHRSPVTFQDTAESTAWKTLAEENATGSIAYKRRNNTQSATKLKYDFSSSDNSYVEWSAPVPTRKDGQRMFGFQAKATGGPEILRIRLTDNTGEVHQYTLSNITNAWESYFIRPAQDHSSYWNGDGNGKVNFPIQSISFIADDEEDFSTASGTVTVKDLQFLGNASFHAYRFKKKKPIIIAWRTTKKRINFRSVRAGSHRIIRVTSDTSKKRKKKFRLTVRKTPLIIYAPKK